MYFKSNKRSLGEQKKNRTDPKLLSTSAISKKLLYIYIYIAAWKFVNPLQFSIFLHKYDPKHHQIFTQVLNVDKENPIKQMRQKNLCHLFIEKNDPLSKSMWISRISWSFEGEIRVHLFRGVFKQWDDYRVSLPALFNLKNRDLSKFDCVCGSESLHKQRRSLRTSEKELLLLIRLEKVTKPSLKGLDSTNPQSDRLCTNGGNSRPLLPSPRVVHQQRSLQKQDV